MTPEQFEALFTREGLRPFQPKAGENGLPPMLEVYYQDHVEVFVLALAGYNDWAKRQQYLAQLGARCATTGPVLAVRFGSEAWLRTFTPAEMAARKGRLVETYADKEEAIVVMGQMTDGPGYTARAALHRRPNGQVAYLGDWNVQSGPSHRSPLLEAFWTGYHAART